MTNDSATLPDPPSRPEARVVAPAQGRRRRGASLAPAAAGMVAMHLLLALLFYCVLTPLAWALRLARVRGRRIARDERVPTYWRRCRRPGRRP